MDRDIKIISFCLLGATVGLIASAGTTVEGATAGFIGTGVGLVAGVVATRNNNDNGGV